jgi:hypothetical protein
VLKSDLQRCVWVFRRLLLDVDCEFQRLVHWFANRGGARQDVLTWFPLLQQLHQSRNPRPRQRTTVQQFMLDHPDVVKAAFVSRYSDGGNLTNVEKINLRRKLANTLLNNGHSHLKDGLDKKAAAQFKADTDEWDLALEDVFAAKDPSQYVIYVCLDPIHSCHN